LTILQIPRVTIKRSGSRRCDPSQDHRDSSGRSSVQNNFARSFSTGFARMVHRISTVLVGGTLRVPRVARGALNRVPMRRQADVRTPAAFQGGRPSCQYCVPNWRRLAVRTPSTSRGRPRAFSWVPEWRQATGAS
jgi:hypothetical protein